MSSEISSDFKKFIRCVLGRARLLKKTIDRVTDEKSMRLYLKAFTHSSFDKSFNYEKLELHGDSAINLSGIIYLREKFPTVTSKNYLNKLLHKIIGERWVPKLALSLRFQWWLRYTDTPFRIGDVVSLKKSKGKYQIGLRGKLVNITKDNFADISIDAGKERILVPLEFITHRDILKMLEDVFEAFFGAVLENIDREYVRGAGFEVVYTIVKSVFEEHSFSIYWKKVADPKTRLKQLYDREKWDFRKLTSVREVDEGVYSIFIFIPQEMGGKRIAASISDNLKKAWEKASRVALHTLRQMGIVETLPSPYPLPLEKDEEAPPPLTIPPTFQLWLKDMLTQADVSPEFTEKIVADKYLADWMAVFMNSDYNRFWNLELPMFVGTGVINASVVDYLVDTLPKKREGLSTDIKKNFMAKERRILSNYALEHNFGKYVLYGDFFREKLSVFPDPIDNRLYMDFLDKVFKAFIGALYNISWKETSLHGVSYAICFQFMEKIMSSIRLTQKKDPKTLLKSVFQKRDWGFYPPDVVSDFNEETRKFTVKIYGYPLRDKKPLPRNRKFLGSGKDTKLSEAEQKASQMALKTLRRYRIVK